jgi:hypothetical protein
LAVENSGRDRYLAEPRRDRKLSEKTTAVFGLCPNHSNVEHGGDVLNEAGFQNMDISVLPDNVDSGVRGTERGTKAHKGAATGAGTGAVVGSVVGWLLGIGAVAVPGLGLFTAFSPVLAALAGLCVGGAVGGVTGALIGMRSPEYIGNHYVDV